MHINLEQSYNACCMIKVIISLLSPLMHGNDWPRGLCIMDSGILFVEHFVANAELIENELLC